MPSIESYYIIVNNIQQGPYTLEELREKRITAHTMVWRKGLPQWVAANQLPELRELLSEMPPPSPISSYERPPKTWLVESILVTIFCCLPFGIVGIVYAAKVENAFYLHDINASIRYSNQARKWTLWGMIIGLICWGLYLGIIQLET